MNNRSNRDGWTLKFFFFVCDANEYNTILSDTLLHLGSDNCVQAVQTDIKNNLRLPFFVGLFVTPMQEMLNK